jgi:predicted AlkP superfamily pyrophosphatase or phosphodiesterase
VGDHLTLDFSKTLIKHEELGQDEIPDYLSISFSGVDAVNHFFGPSSLENEDIIIQLDRTLADLFAFIEKEIGLKHTLVVFSADHGMADMPEYMTKLGYQAGRLDPDEIVTAAQRTGQQLGVNDVVRFFYRPYLYLDDEKIESANVDPQLVELAIAQALTDMEGVALAVAESVLSAQDPNPVVAQVRNNYHVSRSGDIYIVQEPYWFLFEKGSVVAMHGSPWRYDTHVPIIFMGPGIKSQMVHRRVHPVDVAPTIAAFVGITPPGSSQGTALEEVLK